LQDPQRPLEGRINILVSQLGQDNIGRFRLCKSFLL